MMQTRQQDMTPRVVRTAIDAKYVGAIDQATPTPCPPG